MSDSTPFQQTEIHLQAALQDFENDNLPKGLRSLTMALQSINDRIAAIEEQLGVDSDD